MGRRSAGLLQRPSVPTEPSLQPEPPAAMLTVKQVARALGVGEQMVYRLLEQETLLSETKPQRVGRLWRIPRREFCAQYGIPETYDFGD